MVLWEIALGTAYFLGLKRSYKLALNLQRRLISPKYPRIRQFAYGRTRAVFDIAVKVHRNVQERDIEAGRNLGNWILRCLDKMKPSANIRTQPPLLRSSAQMNLTKQRLTSPYQKTAWRFGSKISQYKQSGRNLLVSSRNVWRRSIPTIPMLMRPIKPSGNNTQYRQLGVFSAKAPGLSPRSGRFEGVVRKDILKWMAT